MIAYKFLRSGARALFAAVDWPVPAANGPTAWQQCAPGPLVPCRNGLHACRVEDLACWISDELWEVELDAEWISAPDALVARRARLVRRIQRWESPEARSRFSRGCVGRAADSCSSSRPPPNSVAAQYLQQADEFARAGLHIAAAYASALVFSTAPGSTDTMTAFRAERSEQGRLLATIVGLE
jgi:hypothetical protein